MDREGEGRTVRAASHVAVMVSVVALVALPAAGENRASATVKIVVRVRPSLSVESASPVVDAGTVDKGDVSASLGFRVKANAGQVALSVAASDLYKADEPGTVVVMPLRLKASAGARIEASSASPAGGSDAVAPFEGPDRIGAFPALRSRRILFAGSQDHRFDQDVAVNLSWQSADARQPPGDYGGRVSLTAMLMP